MSEKADVVGEWVLVTGGTGFIARWCIVELLGRGFSVRTTVRSQENEGVVRSAVAEAVGGEIANGNRLVVVVVDLTLDDGWIDAMHGCRFVLHPASPLGHRSPEAQLAAAREGTVRVLRSAAAAGVERVVVTSAANASSPTSYRTKGVTDEGLWTDPDAAGIDAYRRSKTLAERAAWDTIAELGAAGGSMSLTTILPGAVLGPVLGGDRFGTAQVIGRLLRGEMARVPRIGLEVVDVRDIAEIHVSAMLAAGAAGERFLATGELIWMPDIAAVLRNSLGEAAGRVPVRAVPDFAVRLMARRRPELRGVLPGLGRRNTHSTAKAARILGWRSRPGAETVIDCARSLIDHGAN